jgi:DNA-binding MarR family transcriptional regulator
MHHEPEGLQGAPASVQAIVHELTEHSPLTGKQIREATGLPRRTVYTALQKLREMGFLKERSSLKDTRQTYFWLSGEAANWVAPKDDDPAPVQA